MVERKYLAHFIDANCCHELDADLIPLPITKDKNGQTLATPIKPDYQRIGQHLEAFAEELNPQVDIRKNILGEQIAIHNGYQVSSTVDTYYADPGNALYDRLEQIANERLTGDDCRTTRLEVMFAVDEYGVNVRWAWKEDCMIAPQSLGGDTSGVQIPYQILNCGNRKRVRLKSVSVMSAEIDGPYETTGTNAGKNIVTA